MKLLSFIFLIIAKNIVTGEREGVDQMVLVLKLVKQLVLSLVQQMVLHLAPLMVLSLVMVTKTDHPRPGIAEQKRQEEEGPGTE